MNRIRTTATLNTRLQAAGAAALVALVALTGAAWLTIGTSEPAPTIVKLERVVIEGRRATETAAVQQLPRVVIVGRRDAGADGTQLAAACTAPTVC